MLRSAVLFGVICFFSSRLIPKTDLEPFSLKAPLKRIIYPGLIAGIATGLALFFLNNFLFSSSVFQGVHPSIWKGAVASLYGGINEEVLLRLFLFTLIYFLCKKLFSFGKKKSFEHIP